MNIELYDPTGNRKAVFPLANGVRDSEKETVKGEVKKIVNKPMKGNWKIKVNPANATATVIIKTTLIY